MPRRIYTYQPELPWSGLNLFVSLSSIILALGFVVFFIDALRSFRSGPAAGLNLWGASTTRMGDSLTPATIQLQAHPGRSLAKSAVGRC